MPQLIKHIDAIARKKQRDVLSIRFHAPETVHEYDYEQDPDRLRVMRWLEEQGMAWQPCGPVASESAMLPYRGDVYVDVPYNVSDGRFQALQA